MYSKLIFVDFVDTRIPWGTFSTPLVTGRLKLIRKNPSAKTKQTISHQSRRKTKDTRNIPSWQREQMSTA